MKITRNFLFLCLALTMSLGAYAQSTGTPAERTGNANNSEREIALKDTPMLVQNAINSDAYQGWDSKKITHITKDGKEYYQVNFTKGDEERNEKFNKDGSVNAKRHDKKSDKKTGRSNE